MTGKNERMNDKWLHFSNLLRKQRRIQTFFYVAGKRVIFHNPPAETRTIFPRLSLSCPDCLYQSASTYDVIHLYHICHSSRTLWKKYIVNCSYKPSMYRCLIQILTISSFNNPKNVFCKGGVKAAICVLASGRRRMPDAVYIEHTNIYVACSPHTKFLNCVPGSNTEIFSIYTKWSLPPAYQRKL